MLERNIEERDEVFCGGRRRIAHFGNDRSYFEEKLYLPLAHLLQVGPRGSGLIDRCCQPMVLIFKFRPSLVKRRD
ncbi:MAG: hypothetical protein JO282_12090 [Alphaproteobacteria bacterium]|nr:hypothetical protein [Alphaproteobacteria bacterium]